MVVVSELDCQFNDNPDSDSNQANRSNIGHDLHTYFNEHTCTIGPTQNSCREGWGWSKDKAIIFVQKKDQGAQWKMPQTCFTNYIWKDNWVPVHIAWSAVLSCSREMNRMAILRQIRSHRMKSRNHIMNCNMQPTFLTELKEYPALQNLQHWDQARTCLISCKIQTTQTNTPSCDAMVGEYLLNIGCRLGSWDQSSGTAEEGVWTSCIYNTKLFSLLDCGSRESNMAWEFLDRQWLSR